jgi:hypothetical protein
VRTLVCAATANLCWLNGVACKSIYEYLYMRRLLIFAGLMVQLVSLRVNADMCGCC